MNSTIRTFVLLIAIHTLIMTEPYDHMSSYPYITGDTFRAFCDHVLDYEATFDPAEVKRGDTIFVISWLWEQFFKEFRPAITTEYILVSNNCDLECPGAYKSYLDDPHLIAWFGINCTEKHPKLFPIPIGIPNRKFDYGNIDLLAAACQQTTPDELRDPRVYGAFHISHPERKLVRSYFRNKPFCLWKMCGYQDYLGYLTKLRYVLSPRGNGIDCFRTWEALLIGCIPIIRTSELDDLYKDFPILIVQDWKEVNAHFLAEQYWLIKNKVWDKNKLFIDYWLDKIKAVQAPYR